jgi:hypothetical protein
MNKLGERLIAAGISFTNRGPALQRLADNGLIEWPDAPDRKPRPGWLVEADS